MKTIDVIIETPKGSNAKFAYEPGSGFFKLTKLLPAGMVFPCDFGFIPETKGGDGDPLDVLVISDFVAFQGCKMECRLIGCIQAMQTEENQKVRNDRFLAVPEESLLFKKVLSFSDLPATFMKEIEAFFIQYNKMQNKRFEISGRLNAQKSFKIIAASK